MTQPTQSSVVTTAPLWLYSKHGILTTLLIRNVAQRKYDGIPPMLQAIRRDYELITVALIELSKCFDELQPIVLGEAVAVTYFTAEMLTVLRTDGKSLTVQSGGNFCLLRCEPSKVFALESIHAHGKKMAEQLRFIAQYCRANKLRFCSDVL